MPSSAGSASIETPRVTAHFAQTIDGRIALEGAPASLSAQEGVVEAHRARAEHDAVLIGSRTLATDDPQLNVRAVAGRNPARVVLSSTFSVPPHARLLRTDGGRVIVVGVAGRVSNEARAALEARGAELICVEGMACGWVSLPHALRALAERGVSKLLVEGGARVLTSFFRERLVHRVQVEIAPRILGDPALPAMGSLGITSLPRAVTIANARLTTLGGNFLLRGDVAYS
jgi:riboflavin-specific deaminase-like protein